MHTMYLQECAISWKPAQWEFLWGNFNHSLLSFTHIPTVYLTFRYPPLYFRSSAQVSNLCTQRSTSVMLLDNIIYFFFLFKYVGFNYKITNVNWICSFSMNFLNFYLTEPFGSLWLSSSSSPSLAHTLVRFFGFSWSSGRLARVCLTECGCTTRIPQLRLHSLYTRPFICSAQ